MWERTNCGVTVRASAICRRWFELHFTGRTWRPPYEANSVIIQATSGCTYGKCRFCSLYKDECFRMSPMEEFEEDLAEIKSYQPYAAVCHFRRQAGRPDNRNYLESGGIRGNMLTRSVSYGQYRLCAYSRFVQFMGVSCNGI